MPGKKKGREEKKADSDVGRKRKEKYRGGGSKFSGRESKSRVIAGNAGNAGFLREGVRAPALARCWSGDTKYSHEGGREGGGEVGHEPA
jgi:hypothetical protein